MWLFKILLIFTFLIIFIQDYKSRLVYWFLYPIVGLLAFLIQTKENSFIIASTNSSINILFITLILLFCFLYAKLKLKKKFVNEVIGVGDILFFVFISFSFSILSFMVFFVFSLLFSLMVHFVLKNKEKDITIPLAGYMSFFFATIYSISFFYNCFFLFAY